MSDQDVFSGNQLSRRDVGKLALTAALGATVLGWPQSGSADDSSLPSGIKLGCGAPVNPTDEELLYLKQMGWDTVNVDNFSDLTLEQQIDVEVMQRIMKRYADAGITVNLFPCSLRHMPLEVLFNRPGRDETIETYKKYIRAMGKAGVHYTRWVFNRAQDVKSGVAETRGAQARDFDLNGSNLKAGQGPEAVAGSLNQPIFGREYSRDEMLANYTYFMKQVVPVAEEAGVRIGFHPDDPPIPSMFGVARILNNFEACKKALEIANSPNVGMCVCCGTWAEGGTTIGIDPAGALRYFGSRKQLFEIHFRNVSSPLPHFNETFPDNGYYDQYKIMKALADVKFSYTATLDHSQQVVGGIPVYNAFALGYMKGLRQVAQSGHTA